MTVLYKNGRRVFAYTSNTDLRNNRDPESSTAVNAFVLAPRPVNHVVSERSFLNYVFDGIFLYTIDVQNMITIPLIYSW